MKKILIIPLLFMGCREDDPPPAPAVVGAPAVLSFIMQRDGVEVVQSWQLRIGFETQCGAPDVPGYSRVWSTNEGAKLMYVEPSFVVVDVVGSVAVVRCDYVVQGVN